jgi:hypothetical protein
MESHTSLNMLDFEKIQFSFPPRAVGFVGWLCGLALWVLWACFWLWFWCGALVRVRM